MSQERDKKSFYEAACLRSTFWDEVEHEVESLDWNDFVEFLEAADEPLPIRAEWRDQLRSRLLQFVRTRYST